MKTTARRGKSLVDEVREVLADVVIAHVPVVRFDFRQKVTYLAVMLRRLMGAVMDPSQTDDRCVIGEMMCALCKPSCVPATRIGPPSGIGTARWWV